MEVIVEQVQPSADRHLRLVPNINRSGRRLPETATTGDLAVGGGLDGESEKAARKLSDREIYSIIVDVSEDELSTLDPSLLIIFAPDLFRVLDQSGSPVSDREGAIEVRDGSVDVRLVEQKKLATKSRGSGIQFYLEAKTFADSPEVKTTNTGVIFRFVNKASGLLFEQTTYKGSDIRTSDLVLLGDDAAPERIFICELDENQPSVRDVANATARIGVPLTLVPKDVAMGDSWLQDQFQVGYTGTGGHAQQIIIHLPRMTNDSALFPHTPNLRNFVDSYFPSNDIGVFKDFWKKKISLTDGTSAAEFDVAETFAPYKKVVRAVNILNGLLQTLARERIPPPPNSQPQESLDLYEVRMAIDPCLERLSSAPFKQADEKADIVGGFKAAVRELSETLRTRGDAVELTVAVAGKGQTFVFTRANKKDLRDFFDAMNTTHSSYNYGGNIEVSPPYDGAKYGKILCGTLVSSPLINFLTSRGASHPYASVCTTWLEVGHIDEIMCFARDPANRFCVVRAAPRLATALLARLVEAQNSGKSVTRLFRGKKWIHQSAVGATQLLRPPEAYATYVNPRTALYDLSGLKAKRQPHDDQKFIHAAFHDDRRYMLYSKSSQADVTYAAFVSCEDLLKLCKRTNEGIEDLYLSDSYRYADDQSYRVYGDSAGASDYRENALPFRLDAVIKKQLATAAIYQLPVVFDTMEDLFTSKTKAITPDLVNLQTLGKHLLVPRPYGPRMRVHDAIEFVKALPASLAPPRDGLNENFVRSRELDKTWHWSGPHEQAWQATFGSEPTKFDPNWKEYWAANNASIYDKAIIYSGMGDGPSNHPTAEPENLRIIADYFRDGFEPFKNAKADYCNGDTIESHPRKDRYDQDIQLVMDQIRSANRGVFDQDGKFLSTGWTRIAIPEDTVDIFELYAELVFNKLGMEIHWVDAWYYHTHSGGIHCGTNVLRKFGAQL